MPTYSEESLGIGTYTTPVITPNQKRTIEFGQHLKGKDINSLLIAITGPSGRRKLFGLQCTKTSPTQIHITKGACIKDFVVIRILEDITITIPSLDSTYYLVLRYRYQESLPTDDADILFITPTAYNLNPSLYLYLSTVVVENATISLLGYDSSVEPPDFGTPPTPEQLNLITTHPITLYIDSSNGNDLLGNGTSTNPFRTITRALSKVPLIIKHPLTLILKSSPLPYDSSYLTGFIPGSIEGQIRIVGETITTIQSTISSYTEDPNTSLCTINGGGDVPTTIPKWVKVGDKYRVVLSGGLNDNVVLFENLTEVSTGTSFSIFTTNSTLNSLTIHSCLVPTNIETIKCNNLRVNNSDCELINASIDTLNVSHSTIKVNRCEVRDVGCTNSNVEFIGSLTRSITTNQTELRITSSRFTNNGIVGENKSTIIFNSGWKSSFDVIDKAIIVRDRSVVRGSTNTVNLLSFEVVDSVWDTYTHISNLMVGDITLPTSTLSVGGSVSGQVRVVSENTTIGDNDFVVFVVCENSPISLTLPTSTPGRLYIIKKLDSTTNTCTLLPSSNQTIANDTHYTISSYSVGVILVGTTMGWEVLSTGDIVENLDNLYYRKTYLYTKNELATPGGAIIDWSNVVNVDIDGGTWS